MKIRVRNKNTFIIYLFILFIFDDSKVHLLILVEPREKILCLKPNVFYYKATLKPPTELAAGLLIHTILCVLWVLLALPVYHCSLCFFWAASQAAACLYAIYSICIYIYVCIA